MIKKIRDKLLAAYRWLVNRLPETLFVLFLVFLAPLPYLLGSAAVDFIRRFRREPGVVWDSLKAHPWPALAWPLCVLGAGGLWALFWPSRRYIWAVARKMIMEAVHRRVVMVLLVFFVVLMPSLPFILKHEGNLKSQVQIVFSYALTLAEVLLCVVAVTVCTASICSEVERKHVHLTDTKPLARWQFLVGKLVGVVVMCSVLLFLMALSVYGLVLYMARTRDFSALRPWEREDKNKQARQVFEEVLVSRRSLMPPMPDVTKVVEEEMAKLRAEGQITAQNELSERERLTFTFQQWTMTVKPLQTIGWKLEGLSADRNAPVYIRFLPRQVNLNIPLGIKGEWQVYWPAGGQTAGPEPMPRSRYPGTWAPKVFQEIRLPDNVVHPSGTIYLAYYNMQNNTSVIFRQGSDVEILQRYEGFPPNYYRSLLVIMCHIVLLAALALMAGAALSFPVASFVVVAIFIVGLIAPWMASVTAAEATQAPDEEMVATQGPVQAWGKWAFNGFLRVLVTACPHFGKYSPVGDLVNGRLVNWSLVGQAVAVLCFLQGTGTMLLGVYLYHRRELARVIL